MALTFEGLIGTLDSAAAPDLIGKLSEIACNGAAVKTNEFLKMAFFMGCLCRIPRSEECYQSYSIADRKTISGHACQPPKITKAVVRMMTRIARFDRVAQKGRSTAAPAQWSGYMRGS
jgi:hypothetical protein